MRLGHAVLLSALALLGVVWAQDDPVLRTTCNTQQTCSACVQANPSCVWCATANYTSPSGFRCYPRGDNTQTCATADVQDPQGMILDEDRVALEGTVQVSPRSVTLRVRPQQPQMFNLEVRPANNFPIDLYLLMDLSFSMNDDLANLQNLASVLASRIQLLSTNFRIGFGSFVEKRLGPYTTLIESIRNNPCGTNPPCTPTYSYRHVVTLTNDSQRFETSVRAQIISGNQDPPEGGFDGFLQSLLCTKLIGWRDVSRKILLYITDAGFHFAGDGKLGGAVVPYPNTCRLPDAIPANDEFVPYEDSDIFDYPSVGQIAQALRDQDIIPIFAATNDVQPIYESLAAELGDGAFVGTLDSDSANVVDLVENLYRTISQRVLFEQEPVPGVSVQVRPTNCPPPGFILNGVCDNLQIENTATFEVSVIVSECTPELTGAGQSVTVRAIGFGNFDIQVNATCQCDCESVLMPNSTQCSENGTLSCGLCNCNPGNFGEACQCDAVNQGTNIDCPKGANNDQCSGRGTCTCGVCNCQSNFFGSACECDERDCINQDNGLVCSGQGTCGCNGQCMCNVEPVSGLPYTGPLRLCECTPNQRGCQDPTNRTSICNGRGSCGCGGTCECRTPYFGQYCELCSGSSVCLETNCESNRQCANCILNIVAPQADRFMTAQYFSDSMNLPPGSNLTMDAVNDVIRVILPADTCSEMCPSGAFIINGSQRNEYFINDLTAVRCEEIRDGCTYQYFVAILAQDFTAVHVAFDRSCPEPSTGTAPYIIILGIIIPLLVLGVLALVLLKVLLLLIDYVEVKKFENELAKTKYSKNENPLYRSAAKDYKNPIYGQ